MSHEVDWQSYGRDYKFFLNILSWLAHTPAPYRYHLAGYAARYFSPQPQELAYKLPKVIQTCYPDAEVDPKATWLRFLHHIGAANLNVFRFANMSPDWLKKHVEIHDQANLPALFSQGKGVLLMTYHNHYPLLFAASIGMMGLAIDPIANDPKHSPIYPQLDKLATQYYDDSEAHFSGGKYCYVADESSVASLRKIAKVLRNGHILLSLNDFPAPADSHSHELQFFGQNIACPTGSVALALRQQAPIVCGWIRWIAKEQFTLELFPLDASDIAGIMQQYQQRLYQLIAADPGNWEGWGWMDYQ